MRQLTVAILAGWSLLLVVPSAHAATIRGIVFNDFNTNGVRDTTGPGALDRGVPGLTVKAFTDADTEIDSAVTDGTGAYTLTAPSARVRVEVEIGEPWWPTQQLAGLRSDEQFVDASTAQDDIDFGVHRLGEFSVEDPFLFWPTQWPGSPADTGGDNYGKSVIRGMRHSADPQYHSWGGISPPAARPTLASFGEVGTIFGLGIDQATGNLYAGAYYKRYAGLTRSGTQERTGAIFRITQQGDVELFADLNAGESGHPTSSDIGDWVGPDAFDDSWYFVGKRGLGSVKVDRHNQNVYAVNLADKSLYRLPIGGNAPVTDRSPAKIVYPGCVRGDWRPFALGFDPADGRLYVGGVCSAEESQSTDDLKAVVLRVDGPASATPTFHEVVSVPLKYRRVDENRTVQTSDWQPWPQPTMTDGTPGPASNQRGMRSTPYLNINGNPHTVWLADESYPQLSAISFDADGSMLLGLRDLMGDMSGYQISAEIASGRPSPTVQGDLLRVARPPGGAAVVESNGTLRGLTGFGSNARHGPLGPGGGFYYDPQAPCCTESAALGYEGGLAQVPGFREVVASSIHVLHSIDDGFAWYPNATGVPARTNGSITRRVQNHTALIGGQDGTPVTGFGKANGLGDLETYRLRAPVQIGNRLWYDEDRDGLQDAGEPPVVDAVVELVLHGSGIDTQIMTTRTDAIGEYIFQIDPEPSYTVRVPLLQDQLTGWRVTQRGAGANDRIDSNGRESDGYSLAAVEPHDVGENDHSFDFGFSQPPPIPNRPPDTPPAPPSGEPPPPEQPIPVAGAGERPLVLVKLADRQTGSAGTRVQFTMVVHNPSPEAIRGVRVCDELPESLILLAKSRFGRNLSGRRVCWRQIALDSGEARRYQVSTRIGSATLGVITNRATASHGELRARARAVVRTRRPGVTG